MYMWLLTGGGGLQRSDHGGSKFRVMYYGNCGDLILLSVLIKTQSNTVSDLERAIAGYAQFEQKMSTSNSLPGSFWHTSNFVDARNL